MTTPKTPVTIALGKRLRRERKRRNLNAPQACDLLGISRDMLRRYEIGQFSLHAVPLRLVDSYNAAFRVPLKLWRDAIDKGL